MAHVGDKRGRDVDDKLKDTEKVTSSDEDVDVDDSDDEVEYDSSRSPELTDEQLFEYYRQAFSSKGFEVPEYGGSIPGGIGRCDLDSTYGREYLTTFAKIALQDYNDKNASYEFDKLLKANSQAVKGLMFYITFHARSGDNASQTFYAKVLEKICNMGTEVKFCVMATKQEDGTSQV
ncbi:hypothetical protein PIB30_069450 [Stylosanthes scabra]|uniref:Cystatin domain-containing protein n=1 Tax=Stylosanthes scabra TaxID=79078 RepID=A0ABU6QP78_9FABA|nr:hypothetical protein [Stylosanthes scabra]